MDVVDWLRRRRSTDRTPTKEKRTGSRGREPFARAVEQRAPGVAEILGDATDDRRHSVLDLGGAVDSSLQVYSRFARRIRFADVFGQGSSREGRARALKALPPQPDDPYDLIFAWDVLDRLFPEERPGLVERLVELSAGRARLHLIVDAAEGGGSRPHRFALLDSNRLKYESTGPQRLTRSPILPAEVERLVDPFRVERAFTLKGGFREYVALRNDVSGP